MRKEVLQGVFLLSVLVSIVDAGVRPFAEQFLHSGK